MNKANNGKTAVSPEEVLQSPVQAVGTAVLVILILIGLCLCAAIANQDVTNNFQKCLESVKWYCQWRFRFF